MAALATAYAAAEEALESLSGNDGRRPSFAAKKEEARVLYHSALRRRPITGPGTIKRLGLTFSSLGSASILRRGFPP